MTVERAWWKEAVVYQVYPRSFADSNGDGIGDLNGITEHLDYLQLLGVDVIWLSPVYQSPNDDNGYDVSDYRQIMSEFGTMEDFERMLQEAHRRGIRIVMDLVVNHTSDEHAWFVESRNKRNSQYREYYIWRDGRKGREPNNWGAAFGGSAWEYDQNTGQYYLHCFSRKQPDLNWDNPEVREEIYSMMNWWCDKGIDGFRMDVISMISKSQEMPDGAVMDGGYGDFGPYVVCGPHVHKYLKEMNEKVLSRYDLLTVGETGTVPIEEAKRFACADGSELNMIFQFEHVELTMGKYGKWTNEKPRLIDLKRSLSKWQTGLEGFAWNSLYLDNHDQPRAVSRFGNDSPEYRDVSAKMLATMLHMLKGTPYIYQGEELGMTNAHFRFLEDYRDIESLSAYHKYVDSGLVAEETMMEYLQEISRDNARTPMQWNTSDHAGFTTGTPWICVNENYRQINAADQIEDPASVFHYFRKLIELRHTYPVIVYGKYEELLSDDPDVFAYRRVLEKQSIVVICNYTAAEVNCVLTEDMKGIVLISNYERHIKGRLQPYEAIVMYQK